LNIQNSKLIKTDGASEIEREIERERLRLGFSLAFSFLDTR
jgi:hypothetical protein